MQLINADCRLFLDELWTSVKKPIIVTDPPFNIGYHYKGYDDTMHDVEYWYMLRDMFLGRPCVVIHYPEYLHRLTWEIQQTPTKVISWVYNSNTRKQHRDIAFYGVTPDLSLVKQPYKNPNDKRIKALIEKGSKGSNLYDWWNINQVKNVSTEKTSHPCQMPLQVMKNIIGILPKDATIIDPFMGSGTTGVACKELDVDFIGIELVKDYYEIAKERITNAHN